MGVIENVLSHSNSNATERERPMLYNIGILINLHTIASIVYIIVYNRYVSLQFLRTIMYCKLYKSYQRVNLNIVTLSIYKIDLWVVI